MAFMKPIRGRSVVALFLFVLAGMALFSCSPDPTVDEILAMAESKADGFQKAVTDNIMVQTIVNQGVKYRVVNHRLGGLYRMDVFMAPIDENAEAVDTPSGVIISDGSKATLYMQGLDPQELKSEDTEQYAGQMFWWESGVAEARMAGSEKVDGFDCYLLEVKRKPDEPFYKLWVEKKTLAQVRSRNDSGGSVVEIKYSDFQTVAGDYRMPFRAEMSEGGRLTAVVQIESIEINQGLSPDMFDADKLKLTGGGE